MLRTCHSIKSAYLCRFSCLCLPCPHVFVASAASAPLMPSVPAALVPPPPVGTLSGVSGWFLPRRFWGGKEGKGLPDTMSQDNHSEEGNRPLSTFTVSNCLTFYYLWGRGVALCLLL